MTVELDESASESVGNGLVRVVRIALPGLVTEIKPVESTHDFNKSLLVQSAVQYV